MPTFPQVKRWLAESWRAATIAAPAAICLVAFLFSLLKGLVVHPNFYATAQYLLNYSHGFVKRGLPGTLLFPALAGSHFAEASGMMILDVSFAALTALVFLAARSLAESVRGRPADGWLERWSDRAVALAFASSALVWHFGLALGYFDVFLATLMILAVGNGRLSLWRMMLCTATAMLTHETAGFLMGPWLLLWALNPDTGGRPLQPVGFDRWGALFDRRRALTALLAGLALVGFTLVLFEARPSPGLATQMRATHVMSDRDLGITLGLLAQDTRRNVEDVGLRPASKNIEGVLFFMSASWAILGLAGWRLWRSALTRAQRLTWLAVLLVASTSSAPLVAFATDYTRFFSFTALQSYLSYQIVAKRLEPVARRVSQTSDRIGMALLGLAVLVSLVNLLTPAEFSFMAPIPRFWPDRWTRRCGIQPTPFDSGPSKCPTTEPQTNELGEQLLNTAEPAPLPRNTINRNRGPSFGRCCWGSGLEAVSGRGDRI